LIFSSFIQFISASSHWNSFILFILVIDS
jgi:hypothetical protein